MTGGGEPAVGPAESARDAAEPAGERQVPFFCPYCGEEELRPAGTQAGSWECRSCSRGFQLRFGGVVTADHPASRRQS
jgi:transposase-like protein